MSREDSQLTQPLANASCNVCFGLGLWQEGRPCTHFWTCSLLPLSPHATPPFPASSPMRDCNGTAYSKRRIIDNAVVPCISPTMPLDTDETIYLSLFI